MSVKHVEALLWVQGNIAADAAVLGPGLALLAHPPGLGHPHQVPSIVKSDLSQCGSLQDGLLLGDNGLVGVTVYEDSPHHDIRNIYLHV